MAQTNPFQLNAQPSSGPGTVDITSESKGTAETKCQTKFTHVFTFNIMQVYSEVNSQHSHKEGPFLQLQQISALLGQLQKGINFPHQGFFHQLPIWLIVSLPYFPMG